MSQGLSKTDLHFLEMANNLYYTTSGSSGEVRKTRGAVIAHGNTLVSKGITGHFGGEQLHFDEDERYIATVNGETVALAAAVQNKVNLNECTIYISDCPAWATFKIIVTLGIKRIVFYGEVNNDRIWDYSKKLGVQVIPVA